ncbi:hypothetical protein AVEN_33657-1 [Araneus ventricosus]|uniref:Uncharacterized protein n=1 Tax=Araneus ventricosus TaxID=182803 RepID=A0A4Y2V3Z9_ARAVE|nr:hypothetical protein AVEN_33657-1 [Araneus ventricosus]
MHQNSDSGSIAAKNEKREGRGISVLGSNFRHRLGSGGPKALSGLKIRRLEFFLGHSLCIRSLAQHGEDTDPENGVKINIIKVG